MIMKWAGQGRLRKSSGRVRGWWEPRGGRQRCGFEGFFAKRASLFGWVELGLTARAYLKALLGTVERKNSWRIAACIGRVASDQVKTLLRRTAWNADALPDGVRVFVVEHLGEPDAGADPGRDRVSTWSPIG
ncbi:hypothetical protein ACIQMR_37640 [Streptomyces sp. NPDC091376]|uniref:hypothetical protein n=1 Tax=Streptomyces sp. NPDC091376 TaxID=3365994 RepID=UPI0038308727